MARSRRPAGSSVVGELSSAPTCSSDRARGTPRGTAGTSTAAVGSKLVLPGRDLDGKSLYDLLTAEKVTFTAAVPTKGVSLPFISVGGSNLIMATVCVALIVNVARRTAAATAGDPWS